MQSEWGTIPINLTGLSRCICRVNRISTDTHGACGIVSATGRLQSLQVLDNLHSLLFGQLPTDHAVAFWAVVKLVSCVGIPGQIGTEFCGTLKRFRVESEFHRVVLLTAKIKNSWSLRDRRKQGKQIGNGTVVKVRRSGPDTVMGPRLVSQRCD